MRDVIGAEIRWPMQAKLRGIPMHLGLFYLLWLLVAMLVSALGVGVLASDGEGPVSSRESD